LKPNRKTAVYSKVESKRRTRIKKKITEEKPIDREEKS
jgi:hypothetical protein